MRRSTVDRHIPAGSSTDQNPGAPISLSSLFWIFLGIASTSFGGYMAMISAVQEAIVTRRRLLRDEDVLEGLSLASALPGPTAVNVVAFLGYRLHGIAGAVVCGCAAVLPAFLFMVVFAEIYLHWGSVPAASKAFMGVVPAVTALIAAAAARMCRSTLVTVTEFFIAFAASVVIIAFSGILATAAVIAGSALAGYLLLAKEERQPAVRASSALPPVMQVNARLLVLAAIPLFLAPLPDIEPDGLLKLGSAFAGMGMLMFGGGYTVVSVFQQVVVDSYGWVSQREFIDALALGQLTPGPIMISAAFIGYKAAGLGGAIAATAGMFVPPAVLMVLFTRFLDGVAVSKNMQAAMRGVRAAAAGMVCAAAIVIGKSAAPHWLSLALFGVSLLALTRYRISAMWVVFAAAAAGYFFYEG